jgi:DNA-binding transcriptional regulator YdaS (Cro superfamily)
MDIRDILRAAPSPITPQALADAIGCHRTTVVKWGRVPASRVPAVSAATGVPRHKIRPDLWEPEGEGSRIAPDAA